ncbi:uncharacterized protein N7483_008034 [Penicillium malachiteum]|uniref:uncharacterized protein n=1 Tax=Penicillium malachiteum TaxID=1324776 RepID=UPI002548D71A|nr:uncharacterized protein N7483_008034 [Penicillium malachiteum]KAJ5726677.1 hypothetical protein N7483_008034 [Penicillium malachiteum]
MPDFYTIVRFLALSEEDLLKAGKTTDAIRIPVHCVEMLRQFVICHAEVGVITHNWVKGYPRTYSDFNTWHECRNFENIFQWAKDYEMQDPPLGPPADHHWAPELGSVILDSPP